MKRKLLEGELFLGWVDAKGSVGRFLKEWERWELEIPDEKNAGTVASSKLLRGKVWSTPYHTRGSCFLCVERRRLLGALSKLGSLDDDFKMFRGHEYT